MIGLSIVLGSLAMAATASATDGHWTNLANSSMYLGVAGGGQHCDPRWCYLNEGTRLIVWQSAGTWLSDQYWSTTTPGTGIVRDYYNRYPDSASMCMGVQGGSGAGPGARLIMWHCDTGSYPDQNWEIIPWYDSRIQAPFSGCYVFRNTMTNLYMGVAGGNVSNGTDVIQWGFIKGTANVDDGTWHKDQFWCPR
jgi:hypothetical protein